MVPCDRKTPWTWGGHQQLSGTQVSLLSFRTARLWLTHVFVSFISPVKTTHNMKIEVKFGIEKCSFRIPPTGRLTLRSLLQRPRFAPPQPPRVEARVSPGLSVCR